MPLQGLNEALDRAASDEDFARQLRDNPEQALAGYDLTAEERRALQAGDAAGLQALGVDERRSKGRTFSDRTAKMRWTPATGRGAQRRGAPIATARVLADRDAMAG